jgi:hypothetical protein
MASTAPMIAAAVARAQRRVAAAFKDAGAVSPDQAIARPRFERHLERKVFERLERVGAILPTGRGDYYLDEPKLAEYIAGRRKRVLYIIGGALAVTLAAIGLTQV